MQVPLFRRWLPLLYRQSKHWLSILVVACLLLGIANLVTTAIGRADTMQVTARIDAPLPTSSAIITFPHDQQHFTAPFITVNGTCGDGAYVVLYQQQTIAGTAACNSGVFSVQIELAVGANQLQAKVYNQTDNEGPQSPAITVYYYPPVVPPTNPLTPPALSPQRPAPPLPEAIPPAPEGKGGRLILSSPYVYRIYRVGDLWQADVAVQGGRAPYAATVEWGDDTVSRYEPLSSGRFTISHRYQKGGIFQPLIRASDPDGAHGSLQLLVTVRPLNATVAPLSRWSLIIPFIAMLSLLLLAAQLIYLRRMAAGKRRPKRSRRR